MSAIAPGFIPELLTGVGRYFPNTMLAVTLIGGLALGNLPWVLLGVGALSLSLVFVTLQSIFGNVQGFGYWFPRTTDSAILQACSVVPLAATSTFYYLPSLWATLTTFFLASIWNNAMTVYTTPATKLPTEALPVQHRKSVGMVSMVAVAILFILLMAHRLRTGCEYTWNALGFPIPTGMLMGIVIGAAAAYGWSLAIGASKSSLYTDLHGVMAGLQPGSLRTNPLACAPRAA